MHTHCVMDYDINDSKTVSRQHALSHTLIIIITHTYTPEVSFRVNSFYGFDYSFAQTHNMEA